jgi:hypothetical protein
MAFMSNKNYHFWLMVFKGLIVKNACFRFASNPLVYIATLLVCAMVSDDSHAQTCNPNITRTAPDARYSAVNEGTEVKDIVTRLVWQRCSLGQRWNGKTCLGTAAALSWVKAQDAAGVMAAGASEVREGGAPAFSTISAVNAAALASAPDSALAGSSTTSWRLPTHKELYTLVEKACRNPAINSVWFPATHANFHWSASPLSDDDSFAWGVDFSDGSGGYDSKVGAYSVRLVRSSP